MDMEKLAMLEAILFTTTHPLTVKDLQKIMKLKDTTIEKLLDALRGKYHEESSGIRLADMGGYMLVVKPEFVSKVSHLTPHSDLSRGLLRVLSIIAYHEPIIQSDIVKVIGNRTYEYVKELKQRGLVKAERKSRTVILVTTPHFEEYFGTKKDEIKRIAKHAEEEAKQKEEERYGAEEKLEGDITEDDNIEEAEELKKEKELEEILDEEIKNDEDVKEKEEEK